MMHTDAWPSLEVDGGPHRVLEASRLKGLASRRQVLADSLRCCVVRDFVPQTGDDEGIYEFVNEVDSNRGSTCVISRKRDCQDGLVRIGTRREGSESGAEWAAGEIDLALDQYVDAYTAEDAASELPTLEDGSVDSAQLSLITRTLPWFDDFIESIEIRSVASFDRLGRIVRDRFCRLKRLYTELARMSYSLLTHEWWPGVAGERLLVLKRNFPRGISGFRTLQNPRDPRRLKSLLIKPTEVGRAHPQILFGGGPKLRRYIEEDFEVERGVVEVLPVASVNESKHCSIPDLKSAWGLFQEVRFANTNRMVPNMAHTEAELMGSLASWSMGEARIFLERLAVHGKNFKRIALAIPEKTERDCVDFYYRFKIHLDMKAVIQAGSASRQDRRRGVPPETLVSHKALIDSIFQQDLSGISTLNNRSLEDLNIRKLHGGRIPVPNPNKAYFDDTPIDLDTRVHLIEVIADLIAKGHPVPEELGIVEYIPTLRVSLSMVKTEISVLLSANSDTRILQAHHTV